MAKRITTNELAERIDGVAKTLDDLAKITKLGFDEQGKRTDEQSKRIDEQGKRTGHLALMMKLGFTEQGKQIAALQTDVTWLKDGVAKNGDAIVVLTNRLDAESAATISRFDRIDDYLVHSDHRLMRIENLLKLAPMPFVEN